MMLLRLLQGAPTTTSLAEKGLSVGTFLLKFHEQLTEKALRTRGLLGEMRPLVREVKKNRELRTVEGQLARLQRRTRTIGHATGRQLYLKVKVKRKMRVTRGAALRKRASETSVSTHAKEWSKATRVMKTHFNKIAKRYVFEERKAMARDSLRLEARMRKLEQEHKEKLKVTKEFNHVLAGRLTDEELEQAVAYFNNELKGVQMEAHIGGFGESPEAPTVAQQRIIWDDAAELVEGPPGPLPWWAAHIAALRQEMVSVAVGLEPDGDEWWLFLTAKLKPHRDRVLDLTDPAAFRRLGSPDRREYDWFPPMAVRDRCMPSPADDFDLYVREGIRIKGLEAVAPHAPILWERWVCGRAGVAVPQRVDPPPRAPRVPRHVREAARDEFH